MCKTRPTKNRGEGAAEARRHDIIHMVAGTSHQRHDFGHVVAGTSHLLPSLTSLEGIPEGIGYLLVSRTLRLPCCEAGTVPD